MPAEVTSALIAALFGLASAAIAFAGKVWLDRRKSAREKQQRHDTALREDTGRIVSQVVEGSAADRQQAIGVLQEALTLWKEEARRARAHAAQWEKRAEEWAQRAEQNRLEYQAMKTALDEEQRRTSKLEGRVACLERKLAERDSQIQELRATLVSDYARKPSTPAPPPDDGSEDETPVIGRGRRHRNGGGT